ncbi:hypothetical protein GGF46_002214 [Coemansia sp. RSA 552]|nr:hypothetical protein GGF46_002214 [Coemansia sp. RSA 552]
MLGHPVVLHRYTRNALLLSRRRVGAVPAARARSAAYGSLGAEPRLARGIRPDAAAELVRQRRRISVQAAVASVDEQPRNADIPLQTMATQLCDLASDMEHALHSAQSAALNAWAMRIGKLRDDTRRPGRLGVIYVNGMEPRAELVARAVLGTAENSRNHGAGLLSASAADSNADQLADWLYSYEQVVLVADRIGIIQTLVATPALRHALRFHPHASLVVSGLESSDTATLPFTTLLRESLDALGMSRPQSLQKRAYPIEPLDVACAKPQTLTGHGFNQDGSQLDLLASALDAAISCVESDCSTAFAPALHSAASLPATGDTAAPVSSRLAALLPGPDNNDPNKLSPSSLHIQEGFEDSDLQAVDTSVGLAKQRVQRWFSSGRIWRAALMRVYEVSDTLVEDCILDGAFEDAELGMIHAAGRLNESARFVARELANELDALSQSAQLPVDPSSLLSAKNALLALAMRKEPIDPFVLTRTVWEARKKLTESNVLDSVPRYIHISLLQFWTIQASALAGAVSSLLYCDIPFPYAAAGGLGLSVAALFWLGHRWNRLQARLYAHIDEQGASLRTELAAVHRSVLSTQLDAPLSACVKDIVGLQRASSTAQGTIRAQITDPKIAAWKTRLASALA